MSSPDGKAARWLHQRWSVRIKRVKPPYVSRQIRLLPHTGQVIPAAEGGMDGKTSNISGLKQINV